MSNNKVKVYVMYPSGFGEVLVDAGTAKENGRDLSLGVEFISKQSHDQIVKGLEVERDMLREQRNKSYRVDFTYEEEHKSHMAGLDAEIQEEVSKIV